MSTRRLLLAGLATCLVLAAVADTLASGRPDGLERVAADHGLAHGAGSWAPLVDYAGPGALVGCALVLAAATAATKVAARFTRS